MLNTFAQRHDLVRLESASPSRLHHSLWSAEASLRFAPRLGALPPHVRLPPPNAGGKGAGARALRARAVGHLVRSKHAGTDDGGVCRGNAVIDSPLLVRGDWAARSSWRASAAPATGAVDSKAMGKAGPGFQSMGA